MAHCWLQHVDPNVCELKPKSNESHEPIVAKMHVIKSKLHVGGDAVAKSKA